LDSPNCDIDHLLKLVINPQRLSAVLKIEPHEPRDLITKEALRAYLDGAEMSTSCILIEELDRLIEAFTNDPAHAHEMEVVRGKEPVAGSDASFEFSESLRLKIEEVSKREAAFQRAEQDNALDEAGSQDQQAINFYDVSPYIIVSKGELIGTVVEKTPGEDGTDVHGKAIATKPGKELPELIDSSFKMNANGTIHAQIAGHLTYESMHLRINPTLEIHSYVDFSTGNITFPQSVLIHEGVRDRFSVKSGEHIEIRKLVEASIIESAKDLILHNGMAGRETGTISTGGNLFSGYLDGVHASILGNCQVTKEITNCHIMIAGKIESPSAVVRGGEISATKGGVVGSLGSVQGVITHVIVGSMPEIEQKIKLARELRPRIEGAIDQQSKELKTFQTSIGKPNPEQATEIWFMESEIVAFQEKLTELDNAIDRLGVIISANTEHQLVVKSVIFAKATIWLPGFKATFEDDVKGELSITLDQSRKPIVIRNGVSAPLHTIARVIADDRVLSIDPPPSTESGTENPPEDLQDAA